jgi:hypothetical protein
MAGAIVPVQQAFNAAVGLGQLSQLRQYYNQFSKQVKAWRTYNRDHNPLHSRSWGQKARASSMPRPSFKGRRPGTSTRRSGYKYGKRKRYSTAQYKVLRSKKRARRYGNVRSAKKLKLPLGGFQQRQIIRLKDCMSFKATAPTQDLYGSALTDSSGTPVGSLPWADKIGAQAGWCRQYNFRLNDLRNHYNQGTLIKGGTGTEPRPYNRWEEPPKSDGANVLRKIPLSLVQAGRFKAYSVIGAEMTIRLTNNESSGQADTGKGHKIWYAWRITSVVPNGGSTPEGEIPDAVPHNTTFQQLKETGRWRCGVVNQGSQDKFAMKTFKIKFKANSLFGFDDGKPGAPNNTGSLRMPDDPTDSDAYNTCSSPPYAAYVQLIIGPQNISDMDPIDGPGFGAPSLDYSLTDVNVDIQTQFYVSLHDPYPIQIVDEDGIAVPQVPNNP